MRIVATFCNQHSSPRLAACVVDVETGGREWLAVPNGFDRGAAGSAEIDGDLLVACQPGGVVRYASDLQPKAFIPTPGARNLHSILYRDTERALYVVSADNDTLFRYGLDDSATRITTSDVVYCADPARRHQDRYHLNSVADWHGELYVTMFGTADGPTHRHRRNGSVVRVGDGKIVADGLYHPHSVFAFGDELLVVESQAHAVRRVAGGPPGSWEIDGGYPRGIVAAGESAVWVGVSALRKESSSLGTPNVLTSTTPIDFETRLVELDLTTGATGRTIDLTALASEVFDLRELPAAAMDSFSPSPDGGLAARVEALEESFVRVRASQRALRTELEHTPLSRAKDLLARLRRRLRRAS